jgi:hypothetical protein
MMSHVTYPHLVEPVSITGVGLPRDRPGPLAEETPKRADRVNANQGPRGSDRLTCPPKTLSLWERESLVVQTKGGHEMPRGQKFTAEQIIRNLREELGEVTKGQPGGC